MRIIPFIIALFFFGFISCSSSPEQNKETIASEAPLSSETTVPYFFNTNQCNLRTKCTQYDRDSCYFTTIKVYARFEVQPIFESFANQNCTLSFQLKSNVKGSAEEGYPQLHAHGSCHTENSLQFSHDTPEIISFSDPSSDLPANTSMILVNNKLEFTLSEAKYLEGGICIVLVTMDPEYTGFIHPPEVQELSLTVGDQPLSCTPSLLSMNYCELDCAAQ